MPSDLIMVYDEYGSELGTIGLNYAIETRNRLLSEIEKLQISINVWTTHVTRLTKAINEHQNPIAESLRGNSNTSKHKNGSTDINS